MVSLVSWRDGLTSLICVAHPDERSKSAYLGTHAASIVSGEQGSPPASPGRSRTALTSCYGKPSRGGTDA